MNIINISYDYCAFVTSSVTVNAEVQVHILMKVRTIILAGKWSSSGLAKRRE